MNRHFKVIFVLLIVGLVVFCIAFATPFLTMHLSGEIVTWAGCKPAGFDSSYKCPEPNSFGDRFGPLTHWIASAIFVTPIIFVDQFWDVLLIWMGVIFIFGMLALLSKNWQSDQSVFLTIKNYLSSSNQERIYEIKAVKGFQSVKQINASPTPNPSEYVNPFSLMEAEAIEEETIDEGIAEGETGVEYAGLVTRIVAALVDALFIGLIMAFLVFGFYVLYINGITSESTAPYMFKFVNSNFGQIIWSILSRLVLVLVPGLIIVTFWRISQATPGKLLLSIKIVDAATKEPASLGQLIVRYFSYYLSFMFYGLGFFWAIFDSRHQGLHDKLARTVVIYTDK